MLIVSQDKDNIVNFNNVISIGIEDFSDSSPWQRITAETLRTAVVLGDYKTEERAKEVLREIIERITIIGVSNCSYEYADIAIKMKDHALYEMPKE